MKCGEDDDDDDDDDDEVWIFSTVRHLFLFFFFESKSVCKVSIMHFMLLYSNSKAMCPEGRFECFLTIV